MVRHAMSTQVDEARRHVIYKLDDYSCTVDEFCGLFGVSKSTFAEYARYTRASPRPTNPIVMTHIWEMGEAPPLSMSPQDAREIAVIALLQAGFSVATIVKALRDKVSRTAVYNMRKAWSGSEGRSPAQIRMYRRHLPSWRSYLLIRPVERRREAVRRGRRWITRGRTPSSN